MNKTNEQVRATDTIAVVRVAFGTKVCRETDPPGLPATEELAGMWDFEC